MRTIVLLLTYYTCAAYSLINPTFGLLFFCHITIFRPESLVWDNLAFGRLHLITSVCVLLGYLFKRGSGDGHLVNTYQKANLRIFFLFVLWLIIVSIFAEYSVQLSLDKAIDVAKIFVLCFLFSRLITTERTIEAYVWVTSVSFGVLSLWGFLQGIAGNPRLDTLWPGGSNYIAAQLALMGPFTCAKIFDSKLAFKWRITFLACSVWITLCSIFTGSRGGFFGLAVGMLLMVVQTKERFKVLASIALIAVLAYPWIPVNYHGRIASIFAEEENRDESTKSRVVLWHIAFRMWENHPLAGVGLKNFSFVKERDRNQFLDLIESDEMYNLIFDQQRDSHGFYTGIMAETGLVGATLFFIFLLRNLFWYRASLYMKSAKHRNMYQQLKGAQAGLIGFAVAAIFGDFQYIEMLYLQIFFIGAVQGYLESLETVDVGNLVERNVMSRGVPRPMTINTSL
jgi:probable O-glycosylation ligase (exosortase A-associated)